MLINYTVLGVSRHDDVEDRGGDTVNQKNSTDVQQQSVGEIKNQNRGTTHDSFMPLASRGSSELFLRHLPPPA